MSSIKIKNLDMYYGSVCALKNVNLEIKDKEFVGIVGPNGGGKSTLLKLILQLLKPTKGTILMDYKHQKIGYVPQFSFFDRNFPIHVLDVILMGTLPKKIVRFHRYSKEEIKKAQQIMHQLDLVEFEKTQIGNLSGGQLQKVILARSLITNPNVLVLDEPTANIDANSRKEIYRLLKEINKDKTILMVTHDLEHAKDYIDRVLYVNQEVTFINGELNEQDQLDKIYGLELYT